MRVIRIDPFECLQRVEVEPERVEILRVVLFVLVFSTPKRVHAAKVWNCLITSPSLLIIRYAFKQVSEECA